MATAPGEIVAILKGIHAPVTRGNIEAFTAWQRAEGGSARFNPFNTTQGANGASNYNSVGVRNYINLQQGINATIQTLRNGHYGPILQALHAGGNPMAVAQAVGASPWGTSGSLMSSIIRGDGGHWPAAAMAAAAGASGRHAQLPGAQGGSQPQQGNLLAALSASLGNYAQTGETSFDPAAAQIQQQAAQIPRNAGAQGAAFPGQSGGPMSRSAQSALQFAKGAIGTPYVWGGESTKGYDCSGLIQAAFKHAGIDPGRTTYDQIKHGSHVTWGSFRPGDLIFSDFEGTGQPTHVVMYIGGGKVVAAPHTGTTVQIENVNVFKNNFVGARRYF